MPLDQVSQVVVFTYISSFASFQLLEMRHFLCCYTPTHNFVNGNIGKVLVLQGILLNLVY
ncbi:hypothetical protein NSTC731_03991 [Nostoc sp. DSM 114167]|jgi:hypothetical protein